MQPEDLQAVADVIAQAIHEALAPVLERFDAVEARLDEIEEGEAALGAVRERVLVLETKAVLPVDLTPTLERLAKTEARLDTLGDLRDRVVMIETKAAQPTDLGEMGNRLLTLETRAAQPTAAEIALADVRGAIEKHERILSSAVSLFGEEVAELRERAAVLETRAPVPGRDGQDGRDGTNGKDGADGLSVEDLGLEFDGVRTLAFRFDRGEVHKVLPVTIEGFLRYQGVYEQGKSYDVGDTVTWGGAMWHCQEPTITKPGESTAWKLCVNRGRDGKAGKDGAPAPIPVVKVGS